MLTSIIQHWQTYCTPENFIGIGSTRKVFRVSSFAIKVHLHPIGYQQSQQEHLIYKRMVDKGWDQYVAQIHYVDTAISIQTYCKPMALINQQSYELDQENHGHLLPPHYGQLLHLLDKEFDCFDIKDSSNYGWHSNGHLVLIDYGMTKKLYEESWVPLAESGILPQIDFDHCQICGIKKELRMYGDSDTDKRCYECGKQ
ncbi:protein kinase [Ornithinibacillus gellani]|uniref:protein kinase n=1 Tax=Ornithinibacillus gellani TaxID=2293253 RepID=UPI000F469D8B|nr:protein kinase [Ornithinibacillus gellani]TQS70556.1 protein kinase [Ornithinibacillus gellani]